MPEDAEKYDYIHLRPCKDRDYTRCVPQFPMMILSMLKSMNTSIQDHLKTLIIAECLDLYWFSCVRACPKAWIHPGPFENYYYLLRRASIDNDYPMSEHAEMY